MVRLADINELSGQFICNIHQSHHMDTVWIQLVDIYVQRAPLAVFIMVPYLRYSSSSAASLDTDRRSKHTDQAPT